MASEEKIVNKIIPIKTIIDVANYLEDQKEEYIILFEKDMNNNINLRYDQKIYQYKKGILKIQYTIKFKDGKEITQEDYNWFIGMLNNLNAIQMILIRYEVSYSTNYEDKNCYEYMHLKTNVYFWEETASLSVDGKNMEEQANKIHSCIREIINNNDERYNKTVKNRKIRIQSFSFSIGFILSYILFCILLVNKAKLSNEYANYLINKYIVVFGQWFIAAIIGNLIGLPIMMDLYKNIIPKEKISHYSKSSHKFVYVDNIEKYITHNEVQIGKYANNAKNRSIIERIYAVTRKIVLIQIVISSLLLIFWK